MPERQLAQFIDTHAHLNEPRFAEDFFAVRERASLAGVHRIILVGYDLDSSRSALDLASAFGDGASAGIHPHDASTLTSDAREILRDLTSKESTVAIGETGLDYHYDLSPRDVQQEALRFHIRLAIESRLPLILHCREAYEDLLRILEEEDAFKAGGVAHCFWGSAQDADRLIEMGFHLGVGGGVTFSKSEELRRILREIPRERIVLETDSPYMAPLPHRGKRNEPAFLPLVAARLAELFEIAPERIAEETTENAHRLFPRLRTDE